jgi:DNA-binding MarR family transcriptional regulator
MEEYDHNKLDDVIHGRARLAVMAFLSAAGEAEFSLIRDTIKATDGNLSAHLRKLEEAGYVKLQKRFVARKPQTRVALTERGRKAYIGYLSALEDLVKRRNG